MRPAHHYPAASRDSPGAYERIQRWNFDARNRGVPTAYRGITDAPERFDQEGVAQARQLHCVPALSDISISLRPYS